MIYLNILFLQKATAIGHRIQKFIHNNTRTERTNKLDQRSKMGNY
mgnify:CR=1 FL=1